MMTKEQLEKIAKRYGIKVSYVEKGNGGFILDDSKKIVKSIKEELEGMI